MADGFLFQSTPPCGGRPGTQQPPPRPLWVSIHAPVRGATRYNEVSNKKRLGFNPRPRAGGDRHHRRLNIPCGTVSIHAPVRGATLSYARIGPGMKSFNPRPRAGGDLGLCSCFEAFGLFQSTPPCGGRPNRQDSQRGREIVSIHAPVRGATLMETDTHAEPTGFNPRPRAGGDQDE